MDEQGGLIRLTEDRGTVALQLNDPDHFNAISFGLGDDMRRAVEHFTCLPHVVSTILSGAGPHFSVGGNPYASARGAVVSHAGSILALRELHGGFVQLRTLPCPSLCAVHGTVVGGGVAACLHSDHVAADFTSVFEHGNLVRGLCVVAMLSQTFAATMGPSAMPAYLQNARLEATAALALGLVCQVVPGVEGTKALAHEVARIVAQCSGSVTAHSTFRLTIDTTTLASEAIDHTEC